MWIPVCQGQVSFVSGPLASLGALDVMWFSGLPGVAFPFGPLPSP
jgi:hypothetical protein